MSFMRFCRGPALLIGASIAAGLGALWGCGGESGGVPTGIGGALVNARVSTNLLTLGVNERIENNPLGVITAIARDANGNNASSFSITLKGAGVQGDDVVYRFNMVDPASAPQELETRAVAERAQALYIPRNAAGASIGNPAHPVYLKGGVFYDSTKLESEQPNGADFGPGADMAIDRAKTTTDPFAVRYLSDQQPKAVRRGTGFDVVLRFYGVEKGSQKGSNSASPASGADPFFTVFYAAQAQIDKDTILLTSNIAPGSDPSLLYGKSATVSTTVSNIPRTANVLVAKVLERNETTGDIDVVYETERVIAAGTASASVDVSIVNRLRPFYVEAQALVTDGTSSVAIAHGRNSGLFTLAPAENTKAGAATNVQLVSRLSATTNALKVSPSFLNLTISDPNPSVVVQVTAEMNDRYPAGISPTPFLPTEKFHGEVAGRVVLPNLGVAFYGFDIPEATDKRHIDPVNWRPDPNDSSRLIFDGAFRGRTENRDGEPAAKPEVASFKVDLSTGSAANSIVTADGMVSLFPLGNILSLQFPSFADASSLPPRSQLLMAFAVSDSLEYSSLVRNPSNPANVNDHPIVGIADRGQEFTPRMEVYSSRVGTGLKLATIIGSPFLATDLSDKVVPIGKFTNAQGLRISHHLSVVAGLQLAGTPLSDAASAPTLERGKTYRLDFRAVVSGNHSTIDADNFLVRTAFSDSDLTALTVGGSLPQALLGVTAAKQSRVSVSGNELTIDAGFPASSSDQVAVVVVGYEYTANEFDTSLRANYAAPSPNGRFKVIRFKVKANKGTGGSGGIG